MSRHTRASRTIAVLDPLPRLRKGEGAYHAVRRAILLGHMKPGDAILEQRIAEQLSCSQGTVREALLRLEQNGLVARRGYRGTVVSTTSVEEAAQMVQIRLQLECAATARLAGALAPETVDELLALTEAMDEGTRARDFYRCSELDREYHVRLLRAAGLCGLEPILNRCTLHIHRFTFHDAETLEPDFAIGDKHRALLHSIAGGDVRAAETAIRSHIDEVIARWAPPIEDEVRRRNLA